MKPRHDDRLIELAFGELSEAEAKLVRESLQLDREGSAELSQFAQLKADLKLLNEIPEPQISTERIREAILGQGLKPKREGLKWAWIMLGPAIASVVAVAVLYSRIDNPHQAAVNFKPAEKNSTSMVAFSLPDTYSFAPPLEITNPRHAALTGFDFGTVKSLHSSRHISRRSHANQADEEDTVLRDLLASEGGPPVAMLAGAGNVQSPAGQASAASPSGGAPASNAVVLENQMLKSSKPMADQKIVVVRDAPDKVTGAQQATEVDSNSNADIGG